MKYDHKAIEKKWQDRWSAEKAFESNDTSAKKKQYVLDMFPYPSGAGLHVGHVEGYTATDIYSRFKRMKGFEVIHPMGWDAFGLPAENYAIKTKVHPKITTEEAIKTFRSQMDSLGLSYDWSREIGSHRPDYYKWTQWFFLLLYKNGLAYKRKAKVNWCSKDQTVLANEQVVDGKCERCSTEVIQKDLEQWFFKITDYAEALLSDLDSIDWPESTKSAQRNWIGKSQGAEIDFKLTSGEKITVFTTRPDTLFGATYMVLAPEHEIIASLPINNRAEVDAYITQTLKRTELERTSDTKNKTGVKLEGVSAINPATKEEIPIYLADYVISHYGTGAIMAVPAHDERDFEFAKKFTIAVTTVVEPETGTPQTNPEHRKSIVAIVRKANGEVLTLNWGKMGGTLFIGGGLEEGEDVIETAKREIAEETGYTALVYRGQTQTIHHSYFAHSKNVARKIEAIGLLFDLENETKQETALEESEQGKFVVEWKTAMQAEALVQDELHKLVFALLVQGLPYTGAGVLINSGAYTGESSEEAKEKITLSVGGRMKTTYKLRDWLISRQRYWGAPIPMIYCEDCGAVPVPESELPVELPDDVDFMPTGESPLTRSVSFQNVSCPTCAKPAKRESDTMDTFVCSSWYYFRFADPKNLEEFASKEKLQKWLPVDLYMGGAEHTVLHLLYARFFTKVLQKLGYVTFSEPFSKLRHQGLILASDGVKMSKSLGNVVNPDDVIEQFGADSIRMYEMFMGPLDVAKPWNTNNILGVRRFLEKVSKLEEKVSDEPALSETEVLLNQTIAKVEADIDSLHFNTAISSLMIFVNHLTELPTVPASVYTTLLKILSPLAPHLTHELWEKAGNTSLLCKEEWSLFDASKIVAETVEMGVQVNGKVRGTVTLSRDASEDEALSLARAVPSVAKWLQEGREVKAVYVAGRIINFVVES